MTHRDKTLLQASMFLLSFACSRSRAADEKFETQAAALLLQRYETVVSTRSKVLSRLHLDNPNQDFGRKTLGLPFVILMGGLDAVGPNTLGTMKAGISRIDFRQGQHRFTAASASRLEVSQGGLADKTQPRGG
jgi:hypothetical protein